MMRNPVWTGPQSCIIESSTVNTRSGIVMRVTFVSQIIHRLLFWLVQGWSNNPCSRSDWSKDTFQSLVSMLLGSQMGQCPLASPYPGIQESLWLYHITLLLNIDKYTNVSFSASKIFHSQDRGHIQVNIISYVTIFQNQLMRCACFSTVYSVWDIDIQLVDQPWISLKSTCTKTL